jgi:hypothetical protein
MTVSPCRSSLTYLHDLRLTVTPGGLHLHIADRGKGFEVSPRQDAGKGSVGARTWCSHLPCTCRFRISTRCRTRDRSRY